MRGSQRERRASTLPNQRRGCSLTTCPAVQPSLSASAARQQSKGACGERGQGCMGAFRPSRTASSIYGSAPAVAAGATSCLARNPARRQEAGEAKQGHKGEAVAGKQTQAAAAGPALRQGNERAGVHPSIHLKDIPDVRRRGASVSSKKGSCLQRQRTAAHLGSRDPR